MAWADRIWGEDMERKKPCGMHDTLNDRFSRCGDESRFTGHAFGVGSSPLQGQDDVSKSYGRTVDPAGVLRALIAYPKQVRPQK